jgi:hypothetical protein
MAVRIIQNNFVSGELSPELWGRHDLKPYFSGAAEIRNFIARRTGGLRKRPGTSVIYELNAITNQVGNRFFAFPYLFDSNSGGIVYLYATGTTGARSIYAGFITVSGSSVAAVAPSLLGISATLNIGSEGLLASIRAKQIGDTLFFTRNRKAAFKCAITYSPTNPAASTLSFSMMQPTTSVTAPDNLTVVARNFKYREKAGTDPTTGAQLWDNYPYMAATKKYALYGVKNGVFSAPKLVNQGIYMPWSAGAYVELSFYPRWDLHDSYVLGKQNGTQYGIIGEFYPNSTQTATPPLEFDRADPEGAGPGNTFRETATEGGIAYQVAPWTAGTGPTGVTAKLKADPNAVTADTVDVELSKYASIYLSTSYLHPSEVLQAKGVITPQYVFPDGFGGGRARVCIGGTVRAIDGQAEVVTSYAGMALVVTPFNYSADGVTFYPEQEVTVGAGNYFDVALPLYNASTEPTGIKNTYGPTVEDPEVIAADGAVKHIGFKIEYIFPDETGDHDARMDECLVINGVAFDESASGTFGLALAECTGSDSFVYALDNTAPEATPGTSADYLTTAITCAWNSFSGAESTAISTTERYESFTENELVTVSSSNGTFHTNSLIVRGTIYVTWPGGAPAALQIWPGAIMQHADGTPATSPTLDAATSVVLSQKNTSGAWTQIGSWNVPKSYYLDPVTRDINTTVANPTNEFKLYFAERTIIRGLALVGSGVQQVFKDDNIAAGSITGIQTRLQVGDSDMSCRVMDIWEQRLVMASSTSLPFTLWFSVAGDLYNFYTNRPQTDSDAFSATIPATKASKILHMVSGRWLTIFTESGEFVCDSSGSEGFSYRSISIKRVSSVGIHPDVEPVATEDRIVFVAHDGRSVYEMRYDISQDSVIPIDRSILAYHLTEGATIVKAAYQRFPDSVVWFLLSDGTMLSMTFMPDQDVIAWARHTIAQPSGFTGTLKLVDIFAIGSVSSATGVETTSDIILQFEVFSGTTRQTKTYLERMRPNICTDAPANDAARCSDHIGIPNPPNVSAKLVTLRPESPDFNTQGLPKNVQHVTIRVRRTHTLSVKPTSDSLAAISTTPGATGVSNTTLFTGDMKVTPRGYVNDDGQLEITSTNNMPCELLSMVFRTEVQQ